MTRADEPHQVVHRGLAPDARISEVLVWAVAHAALAPSEHNSQPWRFTAQVHDDDTATLSLLLDESRRLPVVDPTQREAVLACGAALLNLRLALTGAGYGSKVHLCPDPDLPELLARLLIEGRPLGGDLDAELRLAVALRGTHRGPFERSDVPSEVVDHLVAEAAREGAFVTVLDVTARDVLVRLDLEAEQQLWTDGEFRREAAQWARRNDTGQHDGVPGYAYGIGAVRSWLRPTLLRGGAARTMAPEELEAAGRDAAVVLVVGSPDDSTPAVLRAGQAMQRLLLRARAQHLAASYLNGPLHVPELRDQLGSVLGMPAPQVVVRLGYGELVRPTPRRGVNEVLVVNRP